MMGDDVGGIAVLSARGSHHSRVQERCWCQVRSRNLWPAPVCASVIAALEPSKVSLASGTFMPWNDRAKSNE